MKQYPTFIEEAITKLPEAERQCAAEFMLWFDEKHASQEMIHANGIAWRKLEQDMWSGWLAAWNTRITPQPPVELNEKLPFPLSEVSKESHELANKIMSFFRVGTWDDDGKFIYADPNRLAYLIDSKKPPVEVKDLEKVELRDGVPPAIIDAAILISNFAKVNGWKKWCLMDICSRSLTESTTLLLRKIEEQIEQLQQEEGKQTKLQSQIAVMRGALKAVLEHGITHGVGCSHVKETCTCVRDKIYKALTTDGSELSDKQYESSLKFFGWNPQKETADMFLSGLNGEIETLNHKLSTSLDLLWKAKKDLKWIAELYDDSKTTIECAMDAYEMKSTAAKNLPYIETHLMENGR